MLLTVAAFESESFDLTLLMVEAEFVVGKLVGTVAVIRVREIVMKTTSKQMGWFEMKDSQRMAFDSMMIGATCHSLTFQTSANR